MSREELVESYLAGQMGRRVFLRRLVATGVTTSAALSYAAILESLPAGAAVADFYQAINDTGFAVTPANLAFNQRVAFANHSITGHEHSAVDSTGMGLFNTGPIRVQGFGYVKVPSAGSYPYKCAEPAPSAHPLMTGRLMAPIRITPSNGPAGTTFTVTWAPAALPTGFVVDVQRRAPGSGTWAAWKTGVTARSATFNTTQRGTWSFRARLRRVSNGKSSDWSAIKSVVVS